MANGKNYYSGILGRVSYVPTGSSSAGAVSLPTKTWSGTHTVGALDSTNTESGGFKNVTPGVQSFEGDATLVWDGSSTTDTPPNIEAGTYMHLQLWPNRTLTNPIDVPSAFIKSVKYNDPVEQMLTIDITFESDGAFTMANGT